MRLALASLLLAACHSPAPAIVSTAPLPATPAPSPTAHPAPIEVLSGERAFQDAAWLPSGVLVARSANSVWWIDPKDPDHARRVVLPAPLKVLAVSPHDESVAVASSTATYVLQNATIVRTLPNDVPGCKTCNEPTGVLSTWPTASILQRAGTLQVAGVTADVERAVVCVDGVDVRPWATCRQ